MGDRWRSGLVLLLSVVLFAGVVLFAPGSNLSAVRRLLGLQAPLGIPANVPDEGTYAFFATQPGDPAEPVAWDPCREIHYEVNPDGGPADAVQVVAEALDEASSISGLQFAYDGETDRRPVWESRFVPGFGRAEPVLFAWSDEDEVAELGGDVVGLGGAGSIEESGGWSRYVTGAVTLDTDDRADLAAAGSGVDPDAVRRATLLHEIGHLLGLDHVDSVNELMHPSNGRLLDYAAGDRAGLAALGSGRCG
ncbi:matrixin family metalloprotease [Nocardioides sambongensis]|uniref:matrixin family metalloprotease n=1 Tax=Nocardioides sambongensis TaxID=2589074 RepID=UPI001127E9D0|nr:matrixin family metalloprotease [Nocardioides sambongensis]